MLTGSRPDVCDVQPKNPALAGFNRWGPAAAEVQPAWCQLSRSDVFISRHLPQGRSGYLHPRAPYLLVKVSFTVWKKAPCRSLSTDMAKALLLRSSRSVSRAWKHPDGDRTLRIPDQAGNELRLLNSHPPPHTPSLNQKVSALCI